MIMARDQSAAEHLPPADPIAAAMARAPRAQILTLEQRAELDRQVEDIRSGRTRLVKHEDRAAWLEEHAAELGESEG